MASFPNMACGPISVCRSHWPALPVFSPLQPDIAVHFVLLQPGGRRMYDCLHTISCPLTVHSIQWCYRVKHLFQLTQCLPFLIRVTCFNFCCHGRWPRWASERQASNLPAHISFLLISGWFSTC